MAVKDGDARLCLERAIEDAVEVSAVHGDVAVQIPVAVFVARRCRRGSPYSGCNPSPRRQSARQASSCRLTPAQPAQEVIRELAVERFAQYDAIVQRALQILRMCLFR